MQRDEIHARVELEEPQVRPLRIRRKGNVGIISVLSGGLHRSHPQ
jgi:hypothetical protein